MQINPIRLQPRHSGIASEHFTLRRLQLKQPRRDLLKPLPGTGFLFRLIVDDSFISRFDASVTSALRGVAESVSVEMEVCLEEIVEEFSLAISNVRDTLNASMLSEAYLNQRCW